MNRSRNAERTETTHRPTSVSRVLRAVSEASAPGPEAWDVPMADGISKFKIRVACDLDSRTRAYGLAYRIYRRCGYIDDDPAQLCTSTFDGFAGTMTLLAEDHEGRPVGTISLVFDSSFGLPCHAIYKEEADGLRRQGLRLVEVTRLAMEDDVPNAPALLVYLFSMAYIFARHIGGCTDLIIEVNPRHVAFYRRMLRFHIVGEEKPCPRVKGAPALLLRMNCAEIEKAHTARVEGSGTADRRLHRHPFSPADEQRAAEFMSRQHRPMTFNELDHFKLLTIATRSAV